MDDPDHWRRRAEEARKVAQQLDDPVARQAVLDIAASYDRLAQIGRSEGNSGAAETGSKDRPDS